MGADHAELLEQEIRTEPTSMPSARETCMLVKRR
jgi:hypothetical protein